MPAGFKIAGGEDGSGTTVQQGIVIEDVSASTDENVQGSQYVWIPVGKFMKDDGTESNEIVLGRYTFANDGKGTPSLKQAAYTEESPENFTQNIPLLAGDNTNFTEIPEYREGVSSEGADGLNATSYNLKAWVSSVKANGGYYIGRYEASYASGAQNTSTAGDYKKCKSASKVSTSAVESNMTYNVGTLWHLIDELNASKVAINTYSDSNSVRSDLLSSYAWDTAIVYIQEAGNTNYANKVASKNAIANTGSGSR